MDVKRYLKDLLKFYDQKLDDNGCTMADINSLAKNAQKHLEIWGTIEDIAKYYNKTPNNVRVVINRRLLSKPKRKVLYSFTDFAKIVPDSWKKKDE